MIKGRKNACSDAGRTVIGSRREARDEGADIGRRTREYLAGGINSARERRLVNNTREDKGDTEEEEEEEEERGM